MTRLRTTILLDADILAYRESSRGEVRVDWDGDGEVDQVAEDISVIEAKIDSTVSGLVRALKADRVLACLSCARADNWRKDVLPSYKENRTGALRPLQLMAAREYLRREYETEEWPRLEADDVMAILSTTPALLKGHKIIVSEDKDMKSVPGWLFNPDKDQAPSRIDPVSADRWHMQQTLMGDPTDGYKGCPGIGPKKAEAVLDGLTTYEDMWPAVVRVFEAKKLTEADALVQARVARILRNTDYDRTNGLPILWTPPPINL